MLSHCPAFITSLMSATVSPQKADEASNLGFDILRHVSQSDRLAVSKISSNLTKEHLFRSGQDNGAGKVLPTLDEWEKKRGSISSRVQASTVS